MFLTYQNLTIRNAEASDAEILCKWWNDGNVMAHAGFPNGLGTTKEKILKSLAGDSDDTYRRLIIEVGGVPIGEMSYRSVDGGAAEIGIKICAFEKQEKGLGTLFLRMLITELFRLGYEKIVLDTNVNNARARHVYEKLGFRLQRINENAWRDQLGNLQSSADYALLPQDFQLARR